MLETTHVALQDITLDKILDDSSRKVLNAEFPKIMQQVGIREESLDRFVISSLRIRLCTPSLLLRLVSPLLQLLGLCLSSCRHLLVEHGEADIL